VRICPKPGIDIENSEEAPRQLFFSLSKESKDFMRRLES